LPENLSGVFEPPLRHEKKPEVEPCVLVRFQIQAGPKLGFRLGRAIQLLQHEGPQQMHASAISKDGLRTVEITQGFRIPFEAVQDSASIGPCVKQFGLSSGGMLFVRLGGFERSLFAIDA
jgi:hypothetical protein